jgi:hypothetical protein
LRDPEAAHSDAQGIDSSADGGSIS